MKYQNNIDQRQMMWKNMIQFIDNLSDLEANFQCRELQKQEHHNLRLIYLYMNIKF